MTTPDALRRVRRRDDPTLDAAAQITVDYTGGGDYADLIINPDLAGPDAIPGYEIRAAIAAALEPLRRYNRTITRRYGALDRDQGQFEAAMEKVAGELEQLVHLTPTRAAVPNLPQPPVTPAAARDTLLPDDFPEVDVLREAGYRTWQATRDATDAELRALPGIGTKRLEAIRAAQQE